MSQENDQKISLIVEYNKHYIKQSKMNEIHCWPAKTNQIKMYHTISNFNSRLIEIYSVAALKTFWSFALTPIRAQSACFYNK